MSALGLKLMKPKKENTSDDRLKVGERRIVLLFMI